MPDPTIRLIQMLYKMRRVPAKTALGGHPARIDLKPTIFACRTDAACQLNPRRRHYFQRLIPKAASFGLANLGVRPKRLKQYLQFALLPECQKEKLSARHRLCELLAMSRFTLDQIHTFLTVVRLGGLHRASVALCLTQPALTARIKNLESALACELFERTSGGMKLTKRGELLVAHAEKFEHLVELVKQDIVDPSGAEGRLRIGASETVAQCWLPDLVSRLHAVYPKIEIELKVDVSHDLRDALLNREIDLAILLGPISDYATENISLPGFELVWYASAKGAVPHDATDCLRRPVLSYARNTRPFRELKEKLFEMIGPEATLFPSSSLSACFQLVEADLGVAALPRVMGQKFVSEGRIREFDPGWRPGPLQFTASFLQEPKSHLTETAAYLALEVSTQYAESDD